KQVHRVCHLQAEDLSKHRLFKPGIKTRGWQLGSEEETKFTYNSKGEESTRLRDSAEGNTNQQVGGHCMCLVIIIIL
ncbi:unnamed protein product, partial [Porites evermanni]